MDSDHQHTVLIHQRASSKPLPTMSPQTVPTVVPQAVRPTCLHCATEHSPTEFRCETCFKRTAVSLSLVLLEVFGAAVIQTEDNAFADDVCPMVFLTLASTSFKKIEIQALCLLCLPDVGNVEPDRFSTKFGCAELLWHFCKNNYAYMLSHPMSPPGCQIWQRMLGYDTSSTDPLEERRRNCSSATQFNRCIGPAEGNTDNQIMSIG